MRQRRPAKSSWLQYWPLALLFGLSALLYAIASVLTPFVTAAVLAYMLEPISQRLRTRGCNAELAVGLVLLSGLLILLTLFLIIVPVFARQAAALAGYLPELINWFHLQFEPWLAARFDITLNLELDSIKTWLASHGKEASQAIKLILPSLTSGGLALLGLLTNALLIPVVLFYFLRDGRAFVGRGFTLLPNRWRSSVTTISQEVDAVLGEFLRGQLSVMAIMALFYSGGLWLCGVKSALPIGIIAGSLVFVPYLGVIVGVLLATLAAALQFQSLAGLLPVWGVFLLGQMLEGFVITPRFVGERIGLHPVAVIFALMAFGQLLGFVGILLALPLSAVLLVGLRHLREAYFKSALYQR